MPLSCSSLEADSYYRRLVFENTALITAVTSTMFWTSVHCRRNSFWKASTGSESSLAFWVVFLILLVMIPPTASEETDCRMVSGYKSGPVPDTCSVQLTLNDTETEIISSLKATYQDFPLKCRLRKYILSHLISLMCSSDNNVICYYSIWPVLPTPCCRATLRKRR